MALSQRATLALEGLAKRGDTFARAALNKYLTPRDTMLLKSLARRGDLIARRLLYGNAAGVAAKELMERKAKEGDLVMQGLVQKLAPPPAPSLTAQVITFNPPATVSEAADSPLLLLATSDSGLDVTFEVVSGPATLANLDELTLTGTGDVVVRATQAGNATYAAATPVNKTITVTA